MARLMEQARVELEINGVDNFDVDAVLARAKAARSSLYHHFGSKQGLIHSTQLDQLDAELQSDNAGLRHLVETSTSSTEFFEILAVFIRGAGSPKNVQRRHRRTQVFASATSNAQLANEIKDKQQRATEYLVETLEILRVREWINPPFDLHALAYSLQAMLFGHLILDFSAQPELESEWANSTILAISTICGAATTE